jgi:hypothetical protein
MTLYRTPCIVHDDGIFVNKKLEFLSVKELVAVEVMQIPNRAMSLHH